MRKNFTKFLFLAVCVLVQTVAKAQCGTGVAAGSSSNMFTQIRNGTNPVAADKNLNTVVFIHRNNAAAFGGNSGNLRYDISVNGGVSWTSNQGALNPMNSSLARYPNLTIYNPTNNINPANAYLGYMAATINSVTSAWNGVVTGVRQLGGAGNTESYNQPVVIPQLIPHSIVKGAPGVFWAIDIGYNGATYTGFAIYKGTWNSTINDIVWASNYTITPNFATAGLVGDYNIAFDPSGNIGWFSYLSRLTPGPLNNSYYPIFYKTTNGGLTWTGPIQVDLDQFNCITSNIVSPNVATTNFEHDLVVDVNGNPHMFTTICTGNNGNSVLYANWHHMFDITQINGVWAAYDVANVNAGRGTWGISPNIATMDMAPQAARSADGTKLFFTWSDNSTYALGAANQLPNTFAKAFDVVQKKWTPIKDFTSCNPLTDGKMLFPHLAPEVLEPNANVYQLASVYGEHTLNNDPLQISNFKFLNNTTFAASEFSVNNPSSVVNIQQGNNLLLCPTGSLVISIPGGNYGQILWSNGGTGNSISVATSTNSFYYVTVQQNCYIGIDTISITNLTLSASASSNSICPGNTTTIGVTGNANSYTWSPGSISGTIASVSPTISTVYTLSANGSNNCIATETVPITVYPLPTITVAGPDSICAGSSATLTASGANTYSWSHGALTAISITTPSAAVVYTLVGTDGNLCSNSTTASIEIVPLPTVNIVSTKTIICRGESCTLTANGADSYSWTNTGSTLPGIIASPSVTTTYSVIGTNTFGCIKQSTYTMNVALCAGISASSINQNLMQIYPNPNQGKFTVSSEVDLDLQILNELGQVVRTIHLNVQNERQIDLEDLKSGIYFITGNYQNEKISRKIVVLK